MDETEIPTNLFCSENCMNLYGSDERPMMIGGSHEGHTANVTDRVKLHGGGTDIEMSCSCGAVWWQADDPSGDLGSEEAPEG